MSKLLKYYGTRYARGEVIFREGDDADAMYMIHKGKVEIRKETGYLDEKIQVLGEGEFIGEMAIIDSVPRSANAIALEDCELIRMDRESFEKAIEKNNDFAVNVIRFLSKRLRETDEILAVYMKRERNARLHAMLLKSIMLEGKSDQSGRWKVIERKPFERSASQTLGWEMKMVSEVLDGLILERRITTKKDQKGFEWIACSMA